MKTAIADAPQGMPVRLLFQDEGRFGRINDPRRCWVPLPLRPRVGQQIVRQYVYNYVAVSPMDGRLSSLTLPYANAEAMSVFLEHVANDFAGNWCVMFLDGAGWHIAQSLRIPKTIRLLSLPPYSPELNPAEHIWEDIRENDFRNDVFDSLEAVEQRLDQGLVRLASDPDYVKRLTCFDWINTIPLTSN